IWSCCGQESACLSIVTLPPVNRGCSSVSRPWAAAWERGSLATSIEPEHLCQTGAFHRAEHGAASGVERSIFFSPMSIGEVHLVIGTEHGVR
ncbi:MAG: hypothetical protein WBQ20_01160, partial [Methyloceanibacter sp.]